MYLPVYTLAAPERTPHEVEAAYAEIPTVVYTPPADRSGGSINRNLTIRINSGCGVFIRPCFLANAAHCTLGEACKLERNAKNVPAVSDQRGTAFKRRLGRTPSP